MNPEIDIDNLNQLREKGEMHAIAQGATWKAPQNGASFSALMSAMFYPDDEGTKEQAVHTSLRLSKEQHEEIILICDLWNELDKALGRKRSRKWSQASVIERLLSVAIDSIWTQVGGRPSNKGDMSEFIKRSIALMKKEHGRQK